MRRFSIPRSKLQEGIRLDVPYNLHIKYNQRLLRSENPWIRLSDLTLDINDGLRDVMLKPEGIPFIKLGNLGKAEISYNEVDYIGSDEIDERFRLIPGDVLLSKIGDDPRAALVQEQQYGATYSSDLYRLRIDPKKISPVWLEIFLNTRYAREMIVHQNYGSTLRRMAASDLRNIRIPIPSTRVSEDVQRLEREAQQFSAAARDIFTTTIHGLFAEIDQRIKLPNLNSGEWFVVLNHWLQDRWGASYVRGKMLVQLLEESGFFFPLRELADVAVSSRKNLDPNQEVCYLNISDIDPEFMTFGNVHRDKLGNLSERIRLTLRAYQVLVLASGSNLGEKIHPIAVVEPHLDGCLTSNAFIALEFHDTPIYFGLVMRHPLVLAQLKALAAGSVISFISKREIEGLMLPVLGNIWREDFNDRAQVAWEKRSISIKYRQEAINLVDDFITKSVEGVG
jgi:hypothetical protein